MPTLPPKNGEASPPAMPHSQWVVEGSPNLRDAYVSVCPCAVNHDVVRVPLSKTMDTIAKGILVLPGDRPVIDLKDEQAAVQDLYARGVREAEGFNALMLDKILKEVLKIDAQPDEVEFTTTQPKGNVKSYFFATVTHAGKVYPLPDGLPYRNPKAEGKRRAADLKKKLPGVCYAGCFQPQRKAQNLVRATGLHPLDLDGVDDINALSTKICADKNVFAESLSVTGSGLCAVVRGPVALTPTEYTANYKRIAEAKAKEWGVAINVLDAATSDVSRLRFLSCDEEMYVNWDAEPMVVDVPQQATPTSMVDSKAGPQPAAQSGRRVCNPVIQETRIAPEGERSPISAELLRGALAVIPSDDRQTWLTVTGAVKLWGNPHSRPSILTENGTRAKSISRLYSFHIPSRGWVGLGGVGWGTQQRG